MTISQVIPIKEKDVTVEKQQPNTLQEAALLRDNVKRAMDNYFHHLEGQETSGVYEMVLSEIEAPLLESVMQYTRNNQSKAALVLGINRGTLRTKLKQYGMLE